MFDKAKAFKNITKGILKISYPTKTVLFQIRTEYHHQNQLLALVGLL